MIILATLIGAAALAWAGPDQAAAPGDNGEPSTVIEGESAEAGLLETPSAPGETAPATALSPLPVASYALLATTRGGIMLRLIDYHATQSRRQRTVTGSLEFAIGGSQLGLGIYGVVGLNDAGAGMRRAAAGQIVVGSIGVVTSMTQLVIRSPLERMRRSPDYARLGEDPGDVAAHDALRMDWEAAAKRARKRRFVFGGISLGIGASLTTAAAVRLAATETTSGERVWAYTTITSAIGVVFAGVSAMALQSEEERSLAAIEVAEPRSRPQVRVTSTLGGMAVQGRF